MLTTRGVGLLLISLVAGCAGVARAPLETPAIQAVAREPIVSPTVSPREASQTSATQPAVVAVDPIVPPAAPPVATAPGQSVAKVETPAAKAPAKVLPSRAPSEQVRKQESTPPAVVKPATAPSLDLKSLETRLKETQAIGVFTKLALKNQVDDLLNQFRAHYQGKQKTSLVELRRGYDRLLLKVLALLQDADPSLAGSIVASREAIWNILADPAKFATV